jgi:diaminohydroxyphosphoribosylaminopyrimidine deaminase/5-amino-6-(5-phosphoribosylamino)uracil reductase
MRDPNPQVAGGGCEFLKQNDIDLSIGILEDECRLLNETYIRYVLLKRPFVIAKSALTLDGWTGTSAGHSQWITNEKSRQYVHRLRDQVDAVMVGVGTVIADDPQLTTRLKRGQGKNPIRIILDTHLRAPLDAKILAVDSPENTWMAVGTHLSEEDLKPYQRKGIKTLVCPLRDNKIDLTALFSILAEKSVTSILLEGGATVMGAMIREQLIDKFIIFKAPKILGGGDGIPMAGGRGPERMDQGLNLKDIRIRRFDNDILITGYPDYNKVP